MRILEGIKFRCPWCKRRVGLTAGERLQPHGLAGRCLGSLTIPRRDA